MNKTILQVVEAVSHEKNVDKEVIFEALEAALASATKKQFPGDVDIKVSIDRDTGGYSARRCWTIVDETQLEDVYNPDREILLADALKDNKDSVAGEVVEEPVEASDFGRIESQTAKQVIIQKVREAERARIVQEYESKVGQIFGGVVRKVTRDNIIVEIANNVEALLRKDHLIPRETFRVGDRIRAILADVHPEKTGIQLSLSRTNTQFLIELFKIEVPEIEEDLIEVMGAARDPGARAKLAVKSDDPRLDPVGACVGMRGSRVQAVSNELAGERVDIVLWDDNPAQFVINSMSPAEVVSIIVDEETNSMDIAVKEEQLSQAIGKNGQNIRLASEVTGWRLNVMTDTDAEDKQQLELENLKNTFVEQLGVDDEIALVLIEEGFTTLEEIAYVPKAELLGVENFDEDLVDALRARAKDYILMKAIAGDELADGKDSDDLMGVDGMTKQLIEQLNKHDINTKDDLAELSVDELIEIEQMDEKTAAKMIMSARESWFEQEEKETQDA